MKRKKAEQIFHELFDRNQVRWIGIARCYAPVEERDDLLQEISLQVWRSLKTFQQRAQLDTWAYRVALNTALGWQRKGKRRNEKLPQDSPEVLASLTDSKSTTPETERRMLDGFISTLSKSERAVLLLHMDNTSHETASEILGISSAAYRVRVHRLKKKFEQTFELSRSETYEL